MILAKSVKSRYKYRIISSVISSKYTKFISIDICMDFQLSFMAKRKYSNRKSRNISFVVLNIIEFTA